MLSLAKPRNATFAIYVCLLLPPDADACLEAQVDDQPPAGMPVHPWLYNPLPFGAEQGHHHLTGQSRSKTCRSQGGGRHQEAWGGVYSGSRPEVTQSKEDLMSPLPTLSQAKPGWLPERVWGMQLLQLGQLFSNLISPAQP